VHYIGDSISGRHIVHYIGDSGRFGECKYAFHWDMEEIGTTLSSSTALWCKYVPRPFRFQHIQWVFKQQNICCSSTET